MRGRRALEGEPSRLKSNAFEIKREQMKSNAFEIKREQIEKKITLALIAA